MRQTQKVCNDCLKNDRVMSFSSDRELNEHRKKMHRATYFSQLQEKHVREGGY